MLRFIKKNELYVNGYEPYQTIPVRLFKVVGDKFKMPSNYVNNIQELHKRDLMIPYVVKMTDKYFFVLTKEDPKISISEINKGYFYKEINFMFEDTIRKEIRELMHSRYPHFKGKRFDSDMDQGFYFSSFHIQNYHAMVLVYLYVMIPSFDELIEEWEKTMENLLEDLLRHVLSPKHTMRFAQILRYICSLRVRDHGSDLSRVDSDISSFLLRGKSASNHQKELEVRSTMEIAKMNIIEQNIMYFEEIIETHKRAYDDAVSNYKFSGHKLVSLYEELTDIFYEIERKQKHLIEKL